MSNFRQNTRDPFLCFRPLYGDGEQCKEKIPTFQMIVNHRAKFHRSQLKTIQTHYKKANSKRGCCIENFKEQWQLEENSMLYIVTEKRGNQVFASPMCIEVGLYPGWEHLQKVSLNCSSVDQYNQSALDSDDEPFCYAHQLFYGDVIVVLDLAFYKPPTITSQLAQPTITSYYTLARNTEIGPCLAVREGEDFLIFKGFKDFGYPAAPIKEKKLYEKIEPNSLPAAHRRQLPSAFIVQARIFIPARKCHRMGLFFNQNSRDRELVKQLLIDVANLTSAIISNYHPYIPHVQFLSGIFTGRLDAFLETTSNLNIITALKSLRATKLQTSADCYSDRRYTLFITSGATASPNGEIYVKMMSSSAISFKSYQVGNLVEVDAVWTAPLIGCIIGIERVKKVKHITVRFTSKCGFVEKEDLMDENIVDHADSFDQLLNLFKGMKKVSLRSFEHAQTYDILSSSEKVFNPTALGRVLLRGLQSAAKVINTEDRVHIEHNFGHIYSKKTNLPTTTLTPNAVAIFSDCLRRTPTHEQLLVFEKVLSTSREIHVIESAFGSGKSATAAAAAAGRVKILKKSRVALLAQTNSAVEALLAASNLPEFFDYDVYDTTSVRPLVIQSKNWKFSQNSVDHPFDHKTVMAKVFLTELQKTDPRSCYGSESTLSSMYKFCRNSTVVDVQAQLPHWKCKILAAMKPEDSEEISDEKLYQYFLMLYQPNVFYATTDMFVAFSGTPYLPLPFFPDMVILDESTMIQPVDLVLFTSKLEKCLEKPVQYVLFGDVKQLEPYNTIRELAPINVSVNKMLLDLNYVPSTLTTVYRCHPAATEVLSKMAYAGSLTSGRLATENYIQNFLPSDVFPRKHPAFHFIHNTYSSKPIAQSRVNPKEADDVVKYVNQLLRCAIQPSSIVVITPYSAQKDYIRQTVPTGVRVATTRQFQGGEIDIVILSACATNLQTETEQKMLDEDEETAADESRIHLVNGVTSRVYLISDPSIILVSLSRARNFTVVFGNKSFLSTIPLWSQFFELCDF